jgi:ABC-type branched-subunit amino acid transport system substrate-binding protein
MVKLPERRFRLGGLMLALSMAVTIVIGSAAPSSAADAIKVGALVQLSGGAAFLGPSEEAAYRMAVAEINKSGGVLGKKLELLIADTATDPATANAGAKRLLNQDHVSVLFASSTSASREAVLPVVRQNGRTLFFYDAIYEGHACDPSMFVMGEVPETQIAPIVPYLQKSMSGKSWYFVGNDYNWPQNTAAIAEKAIPEHGGKLVGTKFVPIGTADFSSILQDIASVKPNFVLLIMLPSDVVAFMKQFHNQGLDQSVTAIATLVEQSAIAAMGPAAKGLLIPAGYFTDATQGAKAFEAAYKAELGGNAPAQNFIALNGYDALHLWALAVQKAGSVDKEAVTKALPEVARDGPRGKVAYSATTRHATFPIYLARIDEQGRPTIIESFGPVDPGPQCKF